MKAPSTIFNKAMRLIMSNNYNNLWKLHELPSHDARLFLDIIVANAKYNKIQAIQYRDETVFVISEEQYQKLKNS